MDRKLRRWELALMLGVLVAVVSGGWLEGEGTELSHSVIRFHVIANSDSQEDQTLKLAVRDQVLALAQELYPQGAEREQAEEILRENLPALARAGQEEVARKGRDYPVTASLTRCWFPTKEYGTFALPAGEYTALRVVIGEGEGENWWCVAFPPLCMGAASETVEEAVYAGRFTKEQGALLTRVDEGYVLKFKALELWDGLKRSWG